MPQILYNKFILTTLDFPFPMTLVLLHMSFVTACAHVWKRMGWAKVPSISWRDIRMRFGPVALVFGGSLAFSNLAYVYLSVAFIQIMKASMSVWVLSNIVIRSVNPACLVLRQIFSITFASYYIFHDRK